MSKYSISQLVFCRIRSDGKETHFTGKISSVISSSSGSQYIVRPIKIIKDECIMFMRDGLPSDAILVYEHEIILEEPGSLLLGLL